ncbi:MAG: DUF6270 domain-containing protein [Clostridium sp.]
MNIQIKGSCVTREAFNYYKEIIKDEEIIVDNYIFQKPIAVLGSEKIIIEEEKKDKIQCNLINSNSVRDFVVRDLTQSLDKNYIKADKAHDYFFIDLVDERMSLIPYQNSFLEYRPEILKEFRGVKRIKNTTELFKKYFDNFIKEVLKYYSKDNIILHKAYGVYTTKFKETDYDLIETFEDLNDKKNIINYSQQRVINTNKWYMELYDYIEENYSYIKVIEIPLCKYGSDIDHKYKRGIYHYEKAYYLEFLEAFKDIIEGKYSKQSVFEINKYNKDKIKFLENEMLIKDDITKNNEKIDELKKQVGQLKEMNLSKLKSKSRVNVIRGINGEILYKNVTKNGVLIARIHYNNNKLDKKEIYNTFGEIETIIKYIGSKSIYDEISIDKEGDITEIRRVDNGKLQEVLMYRDTKRTGVPEMRIRFDESGKRKTFERFHFNGKRFSLTLYNENGGYKEVRFFNPNGSIKKRRIYIQKNRVLKDLEFNEGKIVKEILYFGNGCKKEIRYYNGNGEIGYRKKREKMNQNYVII